MKHLIAALLRYKQFHYISAALSGSTHIGVEPELLLLERFIDPNKAFFDIGANAGSYLYAARNYLAPARMYAFEPQAQYVAKLKKLFPDVHVLQAALSSREGSASFKVPRIHGQEYPARGTLERFKEAGEDGARVEEVQTMTLDNAAEALRSGPVGCIKIDVEGHEREVLLGAQKTLRQDRPALIVEIEQRHHEEPIEKIFELITRCGYEGFFWDRTLGALQPLSRFSVRTHQQMDDFKTSKYVNNFIFTSHE